MAIEHIEAPLSWSDQPGYRLTFLGFGNPPVGSHAVNVVMEVEAIEHIGFWQPGWLWWFRKPKVWCRAFVGYYVWSDCRTGRRVSLNLENALIQLRIKAQDAGRAALDGIVQEAWAALDEGDEEYARLQAERDDADWAPYAVEAKKP